MRCSCLCWRAGWFRARYQLSRQASERCDKKAELYAREDLTADINHFIGCAACRVSISAPEKQSVRGVQVWCSFVHMHVGHATVDIRTLHISIAVDSVKAHGVLNDAELYPMPRTRGHGGTCIARSAAGCDTATLLKGSMNLLSLRDTVPQWLCPLAAALT